MAGLFLRYLRFLLFNPKPMNQQEETEITENGKQKLKGGRRFQGGLTVSRNRHSTIDPGRKTRFPLDGHYL